MLVAHVRMRGGKFIFFFTLFLLSSPPSIYSPSSTLPLFSPSFLSSSLPPFSLLSLPVSLFSISLSLSFLSSVHSPSLLSSFFLLPFHFSLPPQAGTMMTLDPQRYSIISRTHMTEQLARLVGHVTFPTHHDTMRCAVLKEIWDFEGDRAVFNLTLNSTFKKLVG